MKNGLLDAKVLLLYFAAISGTVDLSGPPSWNCNRQSPPHRQPRLWMRTEKHISDLLGVEVQMMDPSKARQRRQKSHTSDRLILVCRLPWLLSFC